MLLGTDTTSPYSIVWTNAPVGTYAPVAAFENQVSCLDTNVQANTSYTYRLRTRNFAGLEEYSNEAGVPALAGGTILPVGSLRSWLQAGSRGEVNYVGSWYDLLGSTNFVYQGATTNRPLVVNGMLTGCALG